MPRAKKNQKVVRQTSTTVSVQKVRRQGKVKRARLGLDNPYLSSLKEPDAVLGARIPDDAMIASGTFQLSSDNISSIDVNGSLGWACLPQGTNVDISLPAANIGLKCQANTTAANVFQWQNMNVNQNGAGATAATLFKMFRVVSACMRVEFMGNTSTDGGLITAWWDANTNTACGGTAAGYNSWNSQLPTSTSAALSKAYSTTLPLRNGCCIIWRPMDNSDYEYQSPDAFLVDTYPEIGYIVTGATTGQLVHTRIVVNYEAIPRNDTNNIVATSTSPHNQSWLDQAASWAQTTKDKVYPIVANGNPIRTAAAQLLGMAATNAAVYGSRQLPTAASRPRVMRLEL